MLEGIVTGGFGNQNLAAYAAVYQKYSAGKNGDDQKSLQQKINYLKKQCHYS
jgi:hypothetical protein